MFITLHPSLDFESEGQVKRRVFRVLEVLSWSASIWRANEIFHCLTGPNDELDAAQRESNTTGVNKVSIYGAECNKGMPKFAGFFGVDPSLFSAVVSLGKGAGSIFKGDWVILRQAALLAGANRD